MKAPRLLPPFRKNKVGLNSTTMCPLNHNKIQNSKYYFKNQNELWTYGILILVSALAAFLAVKNIKLSPDSISYGLVSQQIIAGNGISIPLIWFNGDAVPINGTVPMLMYPPLLPALLALLGGVTPQSFLAAQLLNVICHVAIAIFTFLIMDKLCDNKAVALLTGILVSISFPLLRATHHIWSETLFTSLTLAAIYFLMAFRCSDYNKSNRYLFIASICTSASILTRHAGISILALFFWEALFLRKNKGRESGYGPIIAATAIPVITILSFFARNYFISGLIRRWSQPPIERSFLSAFTGTIQMIFLQFELSKLHIMLIAIFFVIFIGIAVSANRREMFSKFFHSGLAPIVIFIIAYIALYCMAMAVKQPRFELRFMHPLVPFLFIVSISALVYIWRMIKSKGFPRLSVAGIIVSLSIIAFGSGYKTYLQLPELFYKQEQLYSITKSCAYNWIIENYSKDTIIASDKPFHLSFFGGYSTVILPHKGWAPNTVIPDDMESALPKRLTEIGARALVFFDEVKSEQYGSYVAGLYNQEVENDKLTLAYKCSDSAGYNLVYNIKE